VSASLPGARQNKLGALHLASITHPTTTSAPAFFPITDTGQQGYRDRGSAPSRLPPACPSKGQGSSASAAANHRSAPATLPTLKLPLRTAPTPREGGRPPQHPRQSPRPSNAPSERVSDSTARASDSASGSATAMAGSRPVQARLNQQPLPPSSNRGSDGVTAGPGNAGGSIASHVAGRKRKGSVASDNQKKQAHVSVMFTVDYAI